MKAKNIISIISLLLLLLSSSYSQKEANNWYFGELAGITFNSPDGKPVNIENNIFVSNEGNAVYSDTNGNMVLYVGPDTSYMKNSQIRIWNGRYKPIENGIINGDISATQLAIIIPQPGHENIYYVFTKHNQYIQGSPNVHSIYYHIVDMSMNSGNGGMIRKNILLFTPSSESITAVKHVNRKDFWILFHEYDSIVYRTYLLTEHGLSNEYETSEGKNIFPTGYLKSSPDGRKIACAFFDNVELADFDRVTGKLSNFGLIAFKQPERAIYGIEFSPDGKKLYTTGTSYYGPNPDKQYIDIYQFDLEAGNYAQIDNSYKLVSVPKIPVPISNYLYMAMQLGPDGRIYVVPTKKDFLSVINYPNEEAENCGFVEKGFDLNGKICRSGLPNFMSFIFSVDTRAEAVDPICEGDTLFLAASSPDKYSNPSYKWSGPDGFSSDEQNPVIPNADVNHAGTYRVDITSGGLCGYDTVSVVIYPAPVFEIAAEGPTSFCEGGSVTLEAKSDGENNIYSWSTSETTSEITVTEAERYSVIVENEHGCMGYDTISVTVYPVPEAFIDADGPLAFCEGGEVTLKALPEGDDYTYTWSTGETGREITVNQAGKYKVIVVTEHGCADSTEVEVEVYPLPEVEIEVIGVLPFCRGDSVFLYTDKKFNNYYWSTSETSDTIIVKQPGTYSVYVADRNGCTVTDSITIDMTETNISISGDVEMGCVCIGSVCIGSTLKGTVIITNNSDDNAIIENIYLKNNNSAFEIETSRSLPALLAMKETIEIYITFSPDDYSGNADSLVVVAEEPCYQRKAIGIKGAGLPVIETRLPEITAKCGETGIAIPLEARLGWETGRALSFDFSAVISIEPTVFLPDSPSVGRIENGKRIVSLNGVCKLDRDWSQIGKIRGTALLSPDDMSALEVSEIFWGVDGACHSGIPGSITLNGICAHDNRKIIALAGHKCQMIPNPATGLTEIHYQSSIEGEIILKVYNSLGGEVSSASLRNETGGIVFGFDVAKLPVGIYHYRLMSGDKVVAGDKFVVSR